ncbi:hypothetical protein KC19_1G043500 [Ceratodon purpureus]|uniref:Secreted protein n=1 Tax=Ceratodon purpureus TaxID=3225 RepID=A0A8T0J3D9_CERPU|nr:hypothetical protein KC19_1G043200 [Ceratodon purpureus]KAG0589736.1 hypothetical protein KC19_1G043500 [Ceratodon purpureus]
MSAATKLVLRLWLSASGFEEAIPDTAFSTSSISLATRHLCYLFVKSPERDFNHVSAIESCESDKPHGNTLSSIHALTAFNLHNGGRFQNSGHAAHAHQHVTPTPAHVPTLRTTNLKTSMASSTPNTCIKRSSTSLRWGICGSRPTQTR